MLIDWVILFWLFKKPRPNNAAYPIIYSKGIRRYLTRKAMWAECVILWGAYNEPPEKRRVSYNTKNFPPPGHPNGLPRNRDFEEIDSSIPAYRSWGERGTTIINISAIGGFSPTPVFAEKLLIWAAKLCGEPIALLNDNQIHCKIRRKIISPYYLPIYRYAKRSVKQ